MRRHRPLLAAVLIAIMPLAYAGFDEGLEAAKKGDYPTALREWTPLAEQGVPQDYAQGVQWYRKAAEQGYANAQLNLGLSYDKGQGVQQNDAKAFAWYRKAAEQGVAQAQYNLGLMYYNGEGVPQNDALAFKWTRKAAEQGYAQAQNNLGVMYGDGQGVPHQNNKQAYAWFSVASANGYGNANKPRDIVAERLSPADLSAAQALAAQYFEQYKPKAAE